MHKWPVLEAFIFVPFIFLLVVGWWGTAPKVEKNDLKRSVAANTVSAAVNGTLTAASIMLSASLLGLWGTTPRAESKTHIKYGVAYALVSLMAGAIALAYLPARVSEFDVTSEKLIAIAGACQLFFMMAAGTRIFAAILLILR